MSRGPDFSTATRRLRQDYLRLCQDPIPYISAQPLPLNIFEWHYVIKGPADSPYNGGYYHGKLKFPKEYPFRPPSIYMITPSGRFVCNARLCLSISDFHPDTWNPAWSVSSILNGLLSFMMENESAIGTTISPSYEKKVLAKASLEFNLKSETFCDLFPTLATEINARLQAEATASAQLCVDGEHSAGQSNAADSNSRALSRSESLFMAFAFVFFSLLVRFVMQYVHEAH